MEEEKQYFLKVIQEELSQCEDISLIHLIYSILMKSKEA